MSVMARKRRQRSVTRRTRVWQVVEAAQEGDRLSRGFDICILALIFLNVFAVVIGTVASVEERFGAFLHGFEVFSVVIFSAEYAARLWACVTDERFASPVLGRLRFAFTPMALVDLLAIAPFYLPFIGLDLRFVRALRLLRIARIAKVKRYYPALNLIRDVFRDKKAELVLTSFLMGLLLIISASVMYYCENSRQPEAFSSIPAAIWWAVATLTTVGYGDVYPVTCIGKVCASLIALLGICMLALPTGILGAGFVEQFHKEKLGKTRTGKTRTCPHCGGKVEGD
jgi:voltage-gated potassium channel